MTHLFSTTTSDMSQAVWNEISEGMTCLSSQGIADFKAELEKLCSEAPCNQETLKAIRSFFSRLHKK